MQKLTIFLIGLSVLCFIFAVPSSFSEGVILGIGAEAFSRASTNLALIAIALIVWFKKTEK